MNETVNAPHQIDFGFSFWVTLRREAFFGFFAYLFGLSLKARESPSQLTDCSSISKLAVKCFP
jgi:hypothetical protein